MSQTIYFKENRNTGTSSTSIENLFKNLANTISPGGGIKTDISITLSPSVYIYLGIAIFASVMAVILVNKILGEILFNTK